MAETTQTAAGRRALFEALKTPWAVIGAILIGFSLWWSVRFNRRTQA